MRVPSGMMTSPQFRQYLADNGVRLTAEQAVAYVRGVKGNQKIGPAYAAAKGPLMRIANTLIAQQQAADNERAEESA